MTTGQPRRRSRRRKGKRSGWLCTRVASQPDKDEEEEEDGEEEE